MNFNNFIVFDYETGSKNPFKTQPLQLAAVIVDGRKLQLVEGAYFNSLIQPVLDDEEAQKLGLDPLEDKALEVNNLTRGELKDAPPLKNVWSKFCDFANNYNIKKTKWDAPIPVGYNIDFDLTINNRI